MKALLVVAAFLLVPLAGCTAETPISDETAFDDFDVQATDETGVIRGVVIDETVTPVDGVTITLTNGPSTVSNAEGAFVFGDLAPGDYFMTASKLGWSTVQASATVVAGVNEPPAVLISLIQDPSQLPYVVELQWDGYIACGFSFIAACGLPVVDEAVGDEFLTVFELDTDGILYLQSEAVWASTQSVSENLQLWQQATGEGGCTFDAQNGPSPNVINTTYGDYNVHGNRDCFETLGNTTDLYLRIFSGSIDGTFPPTEDECYPVVGLCMGVGMTLEQEFQVFNHLFYGFKPVEGWQFSVDGTPLPPS